jgi:3-oxoacyl-[acyl-carrier protein] reductase
MSASSSKIAFVTGATGTIGSAIAKCLHETGIQVVLGYMSSHQGAEEILASWGNHQSMAIHCDISSRKSIVAAFQRIYDRYGRIDFLVNNAAWTEHIPVKDLYSVSEETIDRILSVNFKGALWCCLEGLEYFKKNPGNNSVVNICSNALKTHNASNLVYISSKAALQALTESLALHHGQVARFNTVAPGLIASKMTKGRFTQVQQIILNKTPIRQLATADDVAETVKMLLCGPAALNGQILFVDGGRTIGN